jgi:hypothetical protein
VHLVPLGEEGSSYNFGFNGCIRAICSGLAAGLGRQRRKAYICSTFSGGRNVGTIFTSDPGHKRTFEAVDHSGKDCLPVVPVPFTLRSSNPALHCENAVDLPDSAIAGKGVKSADVGASVHPL